MVNSENKGIEQRKKSLSTIYEVIFVTLIFVGALVLRIASVRYSTSLLHGNMSLFEQAKISSGLQQISCSETLPLGCGYSYLLSFFFSFLGNKDEAVLVMNLILQMLTLILLFFSCRSLFGRFVACVTVSFYAGMPFFFEQIHEVTYEHLLIFGFAFLLVIMAMVLREDAVNSRKSITWIFLYFLTGIILGISASLEASLVFALFFSLVVIVAKRRPVEYKVIRSKAVLVLVVLLGAATGVLGWILGSSVMFGESISKTVDMFSNLYFSDVLFWVENKMRINYLAGLLVIAFIVRGVLRFFEHVPDQTIPVLEEANVTTDLLTEEEEMVLEEVTPVLFIPNPLPLPKKHEKKELDYRVQVSDDKMYYDLNDSDGACEYKYND